MHDRHVISTLATFFLTTAVCLIAVQRSEANDKQISGTLTLGTQNYTLSDAMAYETKRDGEAFVAILASDRKVPWEKVQATLKANKGSDEHLTLDQPYLILVLKKSGKVRSYSASDGHTSVGRFGSEVTMGKFQYENGRIQGEASVQLKPDALVKSAFDVHWSLDVGSQPAPASPSAPSGPVKPSVAGEFVGNGKGVKLAYVSAHAGEPFDGKPVVQLVFTEKDHSRDASPATKAGFGDYGSALVVSVLPDGMIIGCEVSHAAHSKRPFSSSGTIHLSNFELANGRIAGDIATDGQQEFFGDTWTVKLKFAAPYVAPETKPSAESAAEDRKKPTKQAVALPSADDDEDTDQDDTPAEMPGDKLNVKDLALPKDATDIVYKKLVGQMTFRSPSEVRPLAGEFVKKLESQGWKSKNDIDLITAKSAILNRTRGSGKLTIFIKPAAQGSQVTIMTEGLDWSEKAEKP